MCLPFPTFSSQCQGDPDCGDKSIVFRGASRGSWWAFRGGVLVRSCPVRDSLQLPQLQKNLGCLEHLNIEASIRTPQMTAPNFCVPCGRSITTRVFVLVQARQTFVKSKIRCQTRTIALLRHILSSPSSRTARYFSSMAPRQSGPASGSTRSSGAPAVDGTQSKKKRPPPAPVRPSSR